MGILNKILVGVILTLILSVNSIYAQENDLDNCVLINEKKGVVEVTNANIFVLKGNIVKTPALTEGCIKGIVRNKVIEIILKNKYRFYSF